VKLLVDNSPNHDFPSSALGSGGVRRSCIFLFVAAALLTAAAVYGHGQKQMPGTKLSDNRTEYLWVDRETAALPSGGLNTKLFSDFEAAQISRYLSSKTIGGCIRIQAHIEDYVNVSPITTFSRLDDTSSFIVSGVVKSRSFGFYRGLPGQLIHIGDATVLRDEGAEKPRRDFFVFVPIADFTVAGVRICKTDDRYAQVPQLGERLVVLGGPPIGWDGDILHLTDPAQLVTLSGKTPYYARTLRDTPGSSLPDEEDLLISALRRPRAQPQSKP
jgi:hypothetical protein